VVDGVYTIYSEKSSRDDSTSGNSDGSPSGDSDDSSKPPSGTPPPASSISDVYLPVHAPDDDPDQKTVLLLRTDDPTIKQTMADMLVIERTKPAEIRQWAHKNAGRLVLHRDVSGMVQSGVSVSSSDREQIERLPHSNLAPGYVIVDDGNKPSAARGIAMLVGGLLLGCLSLLLTVGRFLPKTNRTVPPPIVGRNSP